MKRFLLLSLFPLMSLAASAQSVGEIFSRFGAVQGADHATLHPHEMIVQLIESAKSMTLAQLNAATDAEEIKALKQQLEEAEDFDAFAGDNQELRLMHKVDTVEVLGLGEDVPAEVREEFVKLTDGMAERGFSEEVGGEEDGSQLNVWSRPIGGGNTEVLVRALPSGEGFLLRFTGRIKADEWEKLLSLADDDED